MRTHLRRSIVVLSVVLVCLGSVSLVLAAGYANSGLLVDTSTLEKLLNNPNVRIVDARTAKEYSEGHIPNAVHLGADDIIDPNSRIEAGLLPVEQLQSMLGERGIGKDTEIVLYDARGGFLASRIFWMLEHFGHTKVSILNGGFPKWQKEGRQVTTAAPTVQATTFPVALNERRLATADWLLDRADDTNVVVIDVRPPNMYQAGHIPWAKSIPWAQNITNDQTMKSAEELLQHFASQGVTKDKNVAVHCQQGKAAAHSYFTLRLLGYPRVRSYDRSWAEWGNDDALPKVVAAANPCAAKNPCNPCAPKKK